MLTTVLVQYDGSKTQVVCQSSELGGTINSIPGASIYHFEKTIDRIHFVWEIQKGTQR